MARIGISALDFRDWIKIVSSKPDQIHRNCALPPIGQATELNEVGFAIAVKRVQQD